MPERKEVNKMTMIRTFGKKELMDLIETIDAVNAEYIAEDYRVNDKVYMINRFVQKRDEFPASVLESLYEELKEAIAEFDAKHLTPANVKVGQGASVKLYSDIYAGTIVKVTKASITIKRDKATLDPNWKPEFIAGGFAGHCVNNNSQTYTYEPDPNGEEYTLRWSKKYNTYGTPNNPRAIKGRHEFYDYNF